MILQSPFVTSGVRIGTPAVTTRGLKEEDMKTIAKLIKMTITDFDTKADEIRARSYKRSAINIHFMNNRRKK